MKYGKEILTKRLNWFAQNVKLKKCYFGERYPLPDSDCQNLPFPRIVFPLANTKIARMSLGGKITQIESEVGEAIYLKTHCWIDSMLESRPEIVSIVFNENKRLRFVYIDYRGRDTDLTKGPDEYYHIEDISSSCAIGMFRAMETFSESRYGEKIGLEFCRTLIDTALCELENSKETPVGKSTHTWYRIAQFIQDNYTRQIDRNSVAEAVNITPEHVSLLFRKYANTSFTSYMNRLRLAHAAYLLEETDLTIDQISWHCGYGNSTYFMRVFKKHYNTPPGRYRRRQES